MPDIKHTVFSGRLVIVGFGSIGQGVLPLILRHTAVPADRITIVTAEELGHAEANEYGVKFSSSDVEQLKTVEKRYPGLDRRPEVQMSQFCQAHDIQLLTYGTVAGGLLSEAYLGQPEPMRSVLTTARSARTSAPVARMRSPIAA